MHLWPSSPSSHADVPGVSWQTEYDTEYITTGWRTCIYLRIPPRTCVPNSTSVERSPLKGDRLKTYAAELSFIMERGEQAGVSAVTNFPYQMWAAGEFHVDPLKGVRPKAGPDTFIRDD